MFKFTNFSVFTLCFAWLTPFAFGGDLSIDFQFNKKPPRVGLVYAIDGNADLISQIKIDQAEKQFDSMIYVKTPNSQVIFKNSDSMDHNIFSKSKDDWPGFDIGLLPPGGEQGIDSQFPAGKMVRLGCKIHPKMRAYLATVPNNAFQIIEFDRSKTDSTVQISLPPTTTKIGVLLPGYDFIELAAASDHGTKTQMLKRGKERGVVSVNAQ